MKFLLIIKLIVILIFHVFLFAQNGNCIAACAKQDLAQKQIPENKLSFTPNEFYYHNEGDIPVSPALFSNFPTTNTFSSNEKIRETSLNFSQSKTQMVYKLSFNQAAVFGKQSSALIWLYLKVACFRL